MEWSSGDSSGYKEHVMLHNLYSITCASDLCSYQQEIGRHNTVPHTTTFTTHRTSLLDTHSFWVSRKASTMGSLAAPTLVRLPADATQDQVG